jgi:hypothetical protein
MHQHTTLSSQPNWSDSAHARLCVLGAYLRQIGFFEPREKRVHMQHKVLKDTAIQQLEMLFVGMLAGIKAVSHLARAVRVDAALTSAFGEPSLRRSIGDRRDPGCGHRSGGRRTWSRCG